MALRAMRHLQNATIVSFKVATGQTVNKGRLVKVGSGGIQHAGAGEAGIGVATGDGAAGEPVSVALFVTTVVPVTVGTGGATAGKFAVNVADGFTDTATLGGGTVAKNIVGLFLESGVKGDEVGLGLLTFTGVSA